MSWLKVRELLVKALNVDQKRKKRRPVAAREGPWARHWRLGIKLRSVTWHSHSTNQPRWGNDYCRCGYQAPWVWHAPDVFFFPSLICSLSETELPGAVVLLFVFISRVAHHFSASPCASLHPAEWKKLIMNSWCIKQIFVDPEQTSEGWYVLVFLLSVVVTGRASFY